MEKMFEEKCPICDTVNLSNNTINKECLHAEVVFMCTQCKHSYKRYRYFKNEGRNIKEATKEG